MSIFKWGHQGDARQTSTAPEPSAHGGRPEQRARPKPPPPPAASAPGVVPPPAAPIYSTRVEGDARIQVGERVRMARDAQLSAQASIQAGVRVAVQRTRTAAPESMHLARRPVQLPVPMAARPETTSARQSFDPAAAAQAGLLNLAWSWQQAGAPIRAIHAYMDLLSRYPDTPTADAAVADLVELSEKLVQQGHFHIALGIYEEMEEIRQMCEEA
jgi:hypothetical protein